MIATQDGKPIDSASLLSAWMDNFPDMIHSVDEQGNIMFLNRMGLSLHGGRDLGSIRTWQGDNLYDRVAFFSIQVPVCLTGGWLQ